MVQPFDALNQKMRDQEDRLTKREYTAIACLQGILSNAQLPQGINTLDVAQLAIKAADILIRELGKPR